MLVGLLQYETLLLESKNKCGLSGVTISNLWASFRKPSAVLQRVYYTLC